MTDADADADYADDLSLLANTLAQVKSLQNGLEQAAEGFGLLRNANETD